MTFQDNQGCIDLLENKPLCILALLDEECRFPNGAYHAIQLHSLHFIILVHAKHSIHSSIEFLFWCWPAGSDESFAAKVRKTHDKDEFFALPRFSTSAFSIKHYAGMVDYEARVRSSAICCVCAVVVHVRVRCA